jgi:hypothetical protein
VARNIPIQFWMVDNTVSQSDVQNALSWTRRVWQSERAGLVATNGGLSPPRNAAASQNPDYLDFDADCSKLPAMMADVGSTAGVINVYYVTKIHGIDANGQQSADVASGVACRQFMDQGSNAIIMSGRYAKYDDVLVH